MNRQRITRDRLEELERHLLSDRDKAILHSLQKCRYLTSGQIRRLHFLEHKSQSSATRATNMNLAKLQEFGLIDSLKRRIGGVRAGSGASVRLLTDTGNMLLYIRSKERMPRKRLYEPSAIFLEHTLTIAEAYVQVMEICKKHGLEHVKTEIEPTCWRSHVGENGKAAHLKPDLFSIVATGDFEDNWFIEIDLATESYPVVLEKCRRYAHYYKTGIEQKAYGVFPLVVWIVPSLARKEGLQRNLAASRELHPKNIFVVITPDEFEGLLQHGMTPATDKNKENNI